MCPTATGLDITARYRLERHIMPCRAGKASTPRCGAVCIDDNCGGQHYAGGCIDDILYSENGQSACPGDIRKESKVQVDDQGRTGRGKVYELSTLGSYAKDGTPGKNSALKPPARNGFKGVDGYKRGRGVQQGRGVRQVAHRFCGGGGAS